jgi:cytochrome P450
MASCTETMLGRWRAKTEPFEVGAEMMALTLNIIARTMFSTDVSGEVEIHQVICRRRRERRQKVGFAVGALEW